MDGDLKAERTFRTLASAACAILFLDLVLVVVTGGSSILTPATKPSPTAFVIREVLLALALLARFRVLAPSERRISAGQILLMLAVFPSLFHLHFIGRRISGDALYYYVYTRSLVRDLDVDFANEYGHYGLLDRGDHSVPTSTGHIRTIYAIGPGLLWVPFFLAADGLAATLRHGGLEVDTSGYGPLHVNSVALGSFGYGVIALFIIHVFLRRHFGDRPSAGAVALLWWASFLQWYLAEQPLTSHPISVLLIALFFLMREDRRFLSPVGAFFIGLALGVGMSVRWQNGVYLLLPALDLLVAWHRRESFRGIIRRGLPIGLGVFIGAMPQLLAWKAIYGQYLLTYPPQGTDFLRLDRPFLVNTLFSSRHGLLSWTPVFWLCLIGLILLTRRNPRRFALLWAPVLIVTYVNASTGDWWAGGAFSNRRFDSLLPVFALGLAAFLQAASSFVRRQSSSVTAALVMGGAIWNLTWVRAIQTNEAKPGVPLSLAARSLASAQALSHDVGFPTTWPASWIFAARFNTSPAAFDLAAGKYLFYRQNNLNGVADLGEEGDDAFALEGFSGPRQDGAIRYRVFASKARIIVSLDLPEPLTVVLAARVAAGAETRIDVTLNGASLGAVLVTPLWGDARVHGPEHLWRRGPNVLTLETSAAIHLDRVTFERPRR